MSTNPAVGSMAHIPPKDVSRRAVNVPAGTSSSCAGYPRSASMSTKAGTCSLAASVLGGANSVFSEPTSSSVWGPDRSRH
eukprot:613348-Prorocentrum_minimum.AAC.1